MPSAKDAAPVKKGDVLDGKYRVENILGVGGMGVVVAARHIELGTRVALKFLLPALLADPQSVARFQREARAAVRLKSEHTAKVQDVGKLKNGAPYLVMELLVGKDLAHVLTERGPLPVSDAVDYVLQACEAIAEAHACGIIHRDIKPNNLFLTRRIDGRPLVKVLDFGLAKSIDADKPERSLTVTSAVMGSPVYMSPEQLRASKDVGVPTDIWSLGICLYELLTANIPFEAATAAELSAMVLKDPPRPATDFRADLPPDLCSIIEKCLHKISVLRYGDVGALATMLEPFGGESSRGAGERVRAILNKSGKVGDSGIYDSPVHDPNAPTRQNANDPFSETRTAAAIDSKPSLGRRAYAAAGAGVLGAMMLVAVVVTLFRETRTRSEGASASAATSEALPLPSAGPLPEPPGTGLAVDPVPPRDSADAGAPSSVVKTRPHVPATPPIKPKPKPVDPAGHF